MSDTYNGWTNYETWNVALWMDNDEGSQGFWVERAEELVRDNDGDKNEAARDLAQEIEGQHNDLMPEVSGTYADLLGAALSSVNWREIAEHLVADVEVETDDEEAA